MKILVTGGSGMVGKTLQHTQNCIDQIKDDEIDFLSSKDCDLRNQQEVDKLFKEGKYSAVIHLAAMVGGLYKNMNSNPQMLIENMRINSNVLEACNKYNINRGIFCLSSCIYPSNPSKFPMTEEMIDESPPHGSNEGYAYSKRMIKVLCEHYNKDFNREYICLSPVNLYGSYDNFNLEDSHVIPGLIHKLYLHDKKKPETYLQIPGTGKAQRQFLFAPDFAYIILKFLYNTNIKGGVFNICDENEYTIDDLVNKLLRIWNISKDNVKYNSDYSDGIIRKTVCNDQFRQVYPHYKFTTLDAGLAHACYWFHRHHDIVRK
jgi:GDP-L-fucose synthase